MSNYTVECGCDWYTPYVYCSVCGATGPNLSDISDLEMATLWAQEHDKTCTKTA